VLQERLLHDLQSRGGTVLEDLPVHRVPALLPDLLSSRLLQRVRAGAGNHHEILLPDLLSQLRADLLQELLEGSVPARDHLPHGFPLRRLLGL
jgi:hypothetical protein